MEFAFAVIQNSKHERKTLACARSDLINTLLVTLNVFRVLCHLQQISHHHRCQVEEVEPHQCLKSWYICYCYYCVTCCLAWTSRCPRLFTSVIFEYFRLVLFSAIGTDVSAKFKGAFCEAKIHHYERKLIEIRAHSLKKNEHIPVDHVYTHEDVQGKLEVGSIVQVSYKKMFVEAKITHVKDLCQYKIGKEIEYLMR